MTHTYLPLDVTPEQRENLQTLADYLLANDVNDFDMRAFRAAGINEDGDAFGEQDLFNHACGTVGCAVGHGPAAGINPLPDEAWWPYCERVFGADSMTFGSPQRLWLWCFDSRWAGTDNTPEGAGKRIQIALTHGIPENHIDQRYGDSPLEYAL